MKRIKSALCTLVSTQKNLPFRLTLFGSKAGSTLAQSVYLLNKPVSHLPANLPNILIIMLDVVVGSALPDTYGGPIHTPMLDRIAETGIIGVGE